MPALRFILKTADPSKAGGLGDETSMWREAGGEILDKEVVEGHLGDAVRRQRG